MAQLMQTFGSTVAPVWEVPVGSRSPAMQAVERVLTEVARLDTPILLMGERGTGRAYLAARVHRHSPYAAYPFLRQPCGSLAAQCFDASQKGGFWDAGTVYLEDLHQLSAGNQSHVLEAVGQANGRRPRLISAISRPLDEDLQAGRFREDLFFRLNGVALRLPPLRQRREDILPLAEFFLDQGAERLARPRPILSARTREALLEHSWPGNLVELEKVATALLVLEDEELALAEFEPRAKNGAPADSVSLKDAARAASREAERELILKVLTRTRWNRRKAAEFLQISYKALLYKLKQIGVDDNSSL